MAEQVALSFEARPRRSRAWMFARRHPQLVLLLAATGILVVTAALGGRLAPYRADQVGFGRLQAPALLSGHPLGTDTLGRDMLSRVLAGARITLGISLTVVVMTTIWGASCGLCAGWFAGIVDQVVSRTVEVIMAFPALLLAIFVLGVLGRSFWTLACVLTVLFCPTTIRVVRAATISVRLQTYVESAVSVGVGPIRMFFRYIIPNIVAPVIVVASLQLGTAILAESSLSFLGLGVSSESEPSWGKLLQESRPDWLTSWWMWAAPGGAISLSVMLMNLLGDQLRDRLDPRLRT